MEWLELGDGILALILGSAFAASIAFIINYFIKYTDLRLKDKRSFLRLPVAYRFVGFLLLSMVPVIFIGDLYFSFQKNGILSYPDPILFLVSGILLLCGILLILYCKYYVIILEQDGILSRGVFRKRRKIFWKEIESIEFKKSAFLLYDGNNKIEVVTLLSDFEVFLFALEKSVPSDVWEIAFLDYQAQLKRSGV
ncbi:hypothetical protein [Leptospira sarikeiensis]|uniref:PH domain-containing protein n=1 Tax=Leptospira sarikeiensis TaxID=2484943 RepID=A0A4R9KD02_9LEPT|nr:hypothetical protein [Leptospira sarikeiensis]TGL63795.1 hypothetical protein EHQ64_04275 [Leptospira sarikeiensis]